MGVGDDAQHTGSWRVFMVGTGTYDYRLGYSSCKRRCPYLEEHPYHWIGIKVSVVAVSYSTGLLSISTITERTRHPTLARLAARETTRVLM